MFRGHLAKHRAADLGEPDHLHAAVLFRGAAIDVTGFDQAFDQAGDVAVRHHHALGDVGQGHPVGRLVELRHQVEPRQRHVETLAQAAPHLALDQGGAGQKTQPEPQLIAMILGRFDSLGLGIECHGHVAIAILRFRPAAAPAPMRCGTRAKPEAAPTASCGSPFNLEIIRNATKVKERYGLDRSHPHYLLMRPALQTCCRLRRSHSGVHIEKPRQSLCRREYGGIDETHAVQHAWSRLPNRQRGRLHGPGNYFKVQVISEAATARHCAETPSACDRTRETARLRVRNFWGQENNNEANAGRIFSSTCGGVAIAAVTGLMAGQAIAQEKLKIGLVLTLSGPAAVLWPAGARRLQPRRQAISAARWVVATSTS